MALNLPSLTNSTTLSISILILLVLLSAQSSWCIQCYTCKDPICNNPIGSTCNSPEEICVKAVLHVPKKGPTEAYDTVIKGCRKYEDGEPLNSMKCESQPAVWPPFPGQRCWCDDQDLCNASGPLLQNYYIMMNISLLTILAFI